MDMKLSPFHECQFSNRKRKTSMNMPNGVFSCSSSYLFTQIFCVLILVSGSVSSQKWDGVIVTESDYQALQAFKHEITDPNGFLRSWNDSGYGACSGAWAGIKCAKGQVILIQLPWRGLSGRITDKIGQFQALRKLSLHDNLITGQIPFSLGFLPNLRGVQLYNNRLSGSIPPSLGLCPVLQTLDFGNNSLSGVIPSTVVNSTVLFRVDFSFNLLSGEIPVSITQSPSLVFLALDHNNLSGVLPNSFSRMSLLQVVNLSHNQLSGYIPSEIGNLSALRNFDISDNFVNGSLPTSLFNLRNLSVLNVGNNRIGGRISDTFGNISSLRELDLSRNNLSGDIPPSLGELPNLDSFNVSYNNLSGSVPAKLSQKFNSSAFVGNSQLCGYTDSTRCLSSPSRGKRGRKLSFKDIILILVGILLVVFSVICCLLLYCLIRKRKEAGEEESVAASRGEKGITPISGEVEAGGENGGTLVHFDGALAFSADDLLCANAEIMGKSTYGTVYRATMENGIQVVVKRLRERVTKAQREFETEVNVIGKIRHPNLLALRGYYLGPKGEKLLVFDYMPRGSLAAFLHARAPNTPISWETRMKIAKGMTRGLVYLHNNTNIIHGNLTSNNILLDDHTNAKVSDYALWRLMTDAANAHVITTAGALGYRASELSKLKKATTKTDVYSLGVIILELLTGKSPADVTNGLDLPRWVASVVKEEWTNEVFDLELMRDVSVIGDELVNILKLALHCVDPSPSARPEAHQILQQLEDIRPEIISSADTTGALPSPIGD